MSTTGTLTSTTSGACDCCTPDCGCAGFCGLGQFCGIGTTATFHGFDGSVSSRNPSYIMTAMGVLTGTPTYSVLDGLSVTGFGGLIAPTLRAYVVDRALTATIPNDSDPNYAVMRGVWNAAAAIAGAGIGCFWIPSIPSTSDGTAFDFSVLEALRLTANCTDGSGNTKFFAEYGIQVIIHYGTATFNYSRFERSARTLPASTATCSPIYFPVTLDPSDTSASTYNSQFSQSGSTTCFIAIGSSLIDFGGTVEIGP